MLIGYDTSFSIRASASNFFVSTQTLACPRSRSHWGPIASAARCFCNSGGRRRISPEDGAPQDDHAVVHNTEEGNEEQQSYRAVGCDGYPHHVDTADFMKALVDVNDTLSASP